MATPHTLDVSTREFASEMGRALRGQRVAVLTGAGMSTDSGIPDYRGKGSSPRTPMSFNDFVTSADFRRRYWAGAHAGWRRFSSVEPNVGHLTLAAMEQQGFIDGVVSQNVDGLHRRAGSSHVVDLHGSLDRVVCLECGQMFDRESVEVQLEAHNTWLRDLPEAELAPDGDSEVSYWRDLTVPECTVCGGTLKPDVVFFGEFVPPKVYRAASSLVGRADILLTLGTSLAVNSGVRLLEIAQRRRAVIVIVNRGVTKGDRWAKWRLDDGVSEFLSALAEELGLGGPLEDIE